MSDDLISRYGIYDTLNKYRVEKMLEGKDVSLVWECIDKVLQESSAQPTIDAVSKEKYVHALTALHLANEKLAYLGYKPYMEMDGEDIIDVWVKQMLFEERHKQNAVEVVRCKDCKWQQTCGYISTKSISERKKWFCADGEKRDG